MRLPVDPILSRGHAIEPGWTTTVADEPQSCALAQSGPVNPRCLEAELVAEIDLANDAVGGHVLGWALHEDGALMEDVGAIDDAKVSRTL